MKWQGPFIRRLVVWNHCLFMASWLRWSHHHAGCITWPAVCQSQGKRHWHLAQLSWRLTKALNSADRESLLNDSIIWHGWTVLNVFSIAGVVKWPLNEPLTFNLSSKVWSAFNYVIWLCPALLLRFKGTWLENLLHQLFVSKTLTLNKFLSLISEINFVVFDVLCYIFLSCRIALLMKLLR